jgi:hypothetical protein
MTRARFTSITLFAILLAGKCSIDYVVAGLEALPLQGSWQITSVQREGVADPSHVGSHLKFDGNKLTLQSWSYWLIESSPNQWSEFSLGVEGQPTTYTLVPIDKEEAQRQAEMSYFS